MKVKSNKADSAENWQAADLGGLNKSVELREQDSVKYITNNKNSFKHTNFISKVNRVIEENYPNPEFRVTILANIIGISERHLSRKIKTLTDLTTTEYIKFYRLNKAKELLAISLTVGEVSHSVGFSSHAYFSSCFKSIFGIEPSYCRNRNIATDLCIKTNTSD